MENPARRPIRQIAHPMLSGFRLRNGVSLVYVTHKY
jgi:hypothetical protein